VSAWSWRATERSLVLALALAVSACDDDFPLGSWGVDAQPTDPGTTSPMCGEPGTPEPVNTAGPAVGTTTLYTVWSWPAPVDSMEWDLVMESDPQTDGYYWAHQFSWVGGLTGYFGLQAFGGYQEDPTPTPSMPNGSPVDFTKIALFWVAGQTLRGELGDITGSKNARVATQQEPGATFTTINARFDWTACNVYRLRLARYSTEDDGSVWWGAWIENQTTNNLTLLGRILVPSTWGQLSSSSTTYTTRIDNAPGAAVSTCSEPEPASGIFGTPSANDGQVLPLGHKNNFPTPARCPTSRFTDLATGVRQEIGLRLPAP